jgi:hypothetical protein
MSLKASAAIFLIEAADRIEDGAAHHHAGAGYAEVVAVPLWGTKRAEAVFRHPTEDVVAVSNQAHHHTCVLDGGRPRTAAFPPPPQSPHVPPTGPIPPANPLPEFQTSLLRKATGHLRRGTRPDCSQRSS